jgi:outer membrane protein assembly factor BamB
MTTESTEHPIATEPIRPLFPGWISRLIIGVTLAFVVAIRLIGHTDDPPVPLNDPAIRNLLTLVFSFVAGLTAWIWFCFRSAYARAARMGMLFGTLVVIAGSILTLSVVGFSRVLQVSGSMVPQWAPRATKLGKVEMSPTAAPIDLNSTTPDDFPAFLGPKRSAWLQGPELARDWVSNPPKLLWKRPIGAAWSAFAAVNGYAVTLEQRDSDEWVTCYEIATGNPVWGHSIAARHENPLGGIGPRSTPTIYQGRVYALGGAGVLRCLDGGTGQLLWSDELRKRCGLTDLEDEALVQWGRASSPLIIDGLVVVGGGGPAGSAKNLVAFDAESGKLAWESENKKDDGLADQISYASPNLATLAGRQQIFIVNESTVSGHNPGTGERLWSFPWPGHSNADASSSQAVAIDGSHVLLTRGYSGGAELIELIAGPDDTIAARSQWKVPRVLQTKFTNVVVREGHAYGLSEGILECVDLESGKRKWKSGRFEHGQILGVGNLLLVMSEDGMLHLVELNPAKFQSLGSMQVLTGKTWNNLCLYGKRLLVRNAQEAACLELP